MAELYLVRHGQASFGAENYDELSPSGRTQSLWLGEYFAQAKVRFDRVVIGTMQRHRQTADGILSAMGDPQVEIAQDAGLNEYDFQALFAALGDQGLPQGLSATSSKKDFYKGLRHVLQLWADDRLPGVVPETWH
jgi:broad specificity phosphatase PhoE